MKKKLIAVVAACAMALACVGVAFGTDQASITGSTTEAVSPGATDVAVTFSIADNPGIAAMDATLSYDESALTLTGLTVGTALSGGTFMPNVEESSFSWMSATNVTTNDVLFTATFTVSEAAASDLPVSLTVTNLADEGGAAVDNTVIAGTVKVSVATYAVTFDAGEGTGNVPVMAPQAAGTYLVLPVASELSKEGCVFAGWEASTDGKLYEANNSKQKFQYCMTAEPVTFTAQWVPYFKVTVLDNDGETELYTKEYDEAAFAELVSENTDLQSRMMYKGSSWSVITAATYVTLADLVADATDEQTTFAAGDTVQYGTEGFNWTLSYGQLASMDGFYADCEATGMTGTKTVVEPCFALTSAVQTVTSNAGEAQTAAAAAATSDDAPRFILGISADELANRSAGGNYSVTGCTFLTITKNAVTDTAIAFEGTASSTDTTVTVPAAVVTPTGTAGTVEYALATEDAVPAEGWQTDTTFTGLEAATTYYAFARFTADDQAKFTDSVSASLSVTTSKAAGKVVEPVIGAVEYGTALSQISLGENWAWEDDTIVPGVVNSGYGATFTPTDAATVDYSAEEGYREEGGVVYIDRTLGVTVNPKAAVIVTAPTSSKITYGQTLASSALTGGKAVGIDGTTALAGAFSWAIDTQVPTVSDSGTTPYDVVFTPTDPNYTAASTTVTVEVEAISAEDAVIEEIEAQEYTGEAIEPELTITLGEQALVAGADYTVQYANNVEPGTASYTVTYCGNYTGTATGEFVISAVAKVVVETGELQVTADMTALNTILDACKAQYPNAKQLIVTLTVSADADDIDADDKALVVKAAGSGKMVAFYDATLSLTVDDKVIDLGSTNDQLVTVTYPFDIATNGTPTVYVVHDGTLSTLTTTANAEGEYVVFNEDAGTISVVDKQYSTFGFCYSSTSTSKTSTSSSSTSAKTGDNTMTIALVVVAVAAAGAASAYALRRRFDK